jgi:hypothetical protein
MSHRFQDFVTEDEYCDGFDVTSGAHVGVTRFTHSCTMLHNHAGDHYDSTTGHRWVPDNEEAWR